MSGNALKIIGLVASALSIGATLINGWVDDKKMDSKVAEAVAAALKKD